MLTETMSVVRLVDPVFPPHLISVLHTCDPSVMAGRGNDD